MSSKLRALIPTLAAALYVAVLVWQSPHTVHHFFEHDPERQNECALSATAERSAGTTVAGVSLVPVAGFELPLVPVVIDPFVRSISFVLGPRAPPSLTA